LYSRKFWQDGEFGNLLQLFLSFPNAIQLAICQGLALYSILNVLQYDSYALVVVAECGIYLHKIFDWYSMYDPKSISQVFTLYKVNIETIQL